MKTWEECTFKEKLERWQNAERVLVNLPKHDRTKHWNMGHWGIVTDCGTVCCAAGHCGLDPWFRKRGLKLAPIAFEDVISDQFGVPDEGEAVPKTVEELRNFQVQGGQGGFENDVDVEVFFGGEGTSKIFGNGIIRTVDKVIKEIRAHIEDLKMQAEYSKERRDLEIKEARAELDEAIKRLRFECDSDLTNIQATYVQELKEIG